jgi:hypothetical protein
VTLPREGQLKKAVAPGTAEIEADLRGADRGFLEG